MRLLKRFLIVGLMAGCVAALAGCHGSGSPQKLEWHSTVDHRNVLKITLDGHSVAGRIHMALMRSRMKGTFVLMEGGMTTEGKVVQEPEGYTLVSEDGTKQRWVHAETPNVLKDEQGAVWEAGEAWDGTAAATLKEW